MSRHNRDCVCGECLAEKLANELERTLKSVVEKKEAIAQLREALKECARYFVWHSKGPYGQSPLEPKALVEMIYKTLEKTE